MEWWDELVAWLNDNSGAVTALATVGTVLFTAIAAIAAWLSIARARRRERAVLELSFLPILWLDTGSITEATTRARPVIQVAISNRGPADAILVRHKWVGLTGSKGDGFMEPLKPGAFEIIGRLELEGAAVRRNITVSWLDPDGTKRRIRGSYQAVQPWDSPQNRRTSLRVDPETYPIGEAPQRLQRRDIDIQLSRLGERLAHRFDL